MGMAGSFFWPQTWNFGKLDFFRDVQMILLSFFEIPYGDRLAKNVKKRYVQVIPRSTLKHTSAESEDSSACELIN